MLNVLDTLGYDGRATSLAQSDPYSWDTLRLRQGVTPEMLSAMEAYNRLQGGDMGAGEGQIDRSSPVNFREYLDPSIANAGIWGGNGAFTRNPDGTYSAWRHTADGSGKYDMVSANYRLNPDGTLSRVSDWAEADRQKSSKDFVDLAKFAALAAGGGLGVSALGSALAGGGAAAGTGAGTITGGSGIAAGTGGTGIVAGTGGSGLSVGAGGLGAGIGSSVPAGSAVAGGGLSGILGSLGSGVSGMLSDPKNLLNLGSTLYGIYSANKASGAQVDAANRAADLARYMYDTARSDYAPFRQAGVKAIGQLSSLLDNPAGVRDLPGYQFGMGEGTKAIERSAASRGGLYSGATLKALQRFGQDYADTQMDRQYNRLAGIAGTGMTATGGTTSAGQNYASQAGGAYQGAGNARASGYIGRQGAVMGGVNNYLSQQTLADLLRAYGG